MKIAILFFIFFVTTAIVIANDNNLSVVRKNIENQLKTELDWLKNDQIIVLQQLKNNGKNISDLQKVMHYFFAETKGTQKTKAMETLLKHCRKLLKSIIGEKETEEFYEEVIETFDVKNIMEDLKNQVTDKVKKSDLKLFENGCKLLFHFERNLYLSNMIITICDKQFEKDPKNVTHLMKKAEQYLTSYRPAEALKVYDEIAKLFPNQKEVSEKKNEILSTLKHDEL